MRELQFLGMQRLAAKAAQGFDQFGRRSLGQAQVAITQVADDRVSRMGHVYADLVRATGFEPAFNQGHGAELLAHAEMGDRLAAILAHGLTQPIDRMPADGLVDLAAGDHGAVDQGFVLAMHGPRGELLNQAGVRP